MPVSLVEVQDSIRLAALDAVLECSGAGLGIQCLAGQFSAPTVGCGWYNPDAIA